MGLLNFKDMATNPLLQMGLGILGNNTGHYGQFLPAFSKGGLQGLQNVQQFGQQDQLNDLRKQQLKLQESQNDRETQTFQSYQDAVKKASELNPEMAPFFQIDPKSAIKALYPQSGVDPYFQFLPTAGGYAAGNARTGKVDMVYGPDGQPLVRATDDPRLQGTIAGAKAEATGNYKPSNMIDGQILTETQIANMASGGNPSQGNPWQIPPELQAQRDEKARQLIASEGGNGGLGITPPAPFNLSRGIKVPTKAEEAAAVQTAKDNAEFNSPDAIKKRSMANQFKKTTAQNVINSIDVVKDKVDGWSAGTGGNIMRALPFNNDAKDIAADLETIKSNFGFDRLQTMRDMSPTGGALGQVAVQELSALQASVANLNPEVQSPEQLKRNLEKAKTHYNNWLDTLTKEDINNTGGGASGDFSGETMDAMPPPNKHKGKVIEDENGVRYQSNGLQWKEIK